MLIIHLKIYCNLPDTVFVYRMFAVLKIFLTIYISNNILVYVNLYLQSDNYCQHICLLLLTADITLNCQCITTQH